MRTLNSFYCDIHVKASDGVLVHVQPGVTMVWDEAESRWSNDKPISMISQRVQTIDTVEIWRDGAWLRTSNIMPCPMRPSDSLTIGAGCYKLDLDESTRKIVDLTTTPEPVITDEEMAEVAQRLVAMEMSLAKKRRRKPLKAPERPLRAAPL